MARKLLKSVAVTGPNGEHLDVKFYDDHRIRFTLRKAGPMVIVESYIQGQGQNVVIGLTPFK